MDPAVRFATIVQRTESDIRLDEAALCISACARTEEGVDVDEWCRRIDDLARASGATTFDEVRRQMFAVEGFRGDTDDYGDPRNSFLDAVIERRRGIPISLSVLLIEIARRCGVTVFGIGMPGHFLVQEAGARDRWCDPFHEGAMLDRDGCARLFEAGPERTRPLDARDLSPTPPRAILGRMLANLEYGRFGTDPGQLARLSALHLTIPGVPLAQQVQLVRNIARGGDPAAAVRAYASVADAAPDEIASSLRSEAQRLHARWN
jgi:Transglutaminase-like superfamily